MTDTTLEDRVVAFIAERGGGVSFVELEREFPEEFDGQDDTTRLTTYDNIVLCQPVSRAMAEALSSACSKGRIVMESVLMPVYVVDGTVPMVPIARKARQSRTGQWLPVTISLAGPGARRDRGDMASRTLRNAGRQWTDSEWQ